MPQLHLLSPAGFLAAGVYCGIKGRPVPDLGLLVCNELAIGAAAFTTNQVVSPGVTVGRRHVAAGKLRGVVVNSGNANACTGKQGERDAIRMCHLAASSVQASPREFLPSSTGIIGQFLPMEKIEQGIAQASQSLGNSGDHAILF